MSAAAPVTIQLTRDEALVLFEFIARYNHDGRLAVEDRAEDIALWNTLCALEAVLDEPFSANYKELLGAAREALNKAAPEQAREARGELKDGRSGSATPT